MATLNDNANVGRTGNRPRFADFDTHPRGVKARHQQFSQLFRYALNQNYDVREMDDVFETLNRESQLSGGGGRLPESFRVGRAQERSREGEEKRERGEMGLGLT